MEQAKEINIAVKYAEIDDQPYSDGESGWVSSFVACLKQSLTFYFRRPFNILQKKETELISEKDFESLDAVIYVMSPAFQMSSNVVAEIAAIEKALLFNTDYINSKIHKVLKGPVEVQELPATISMGTFHYFYQAGTEEGSSFQTLFEGDNEAGTRSKYWESFTNLLFDLLKNLKHGHSRRFTPESGQTIFLGPGDTGQLWNRTNLFGELISRGVKVLPDHDHSIEVRHLNEPVKYYLKNSDLAIYFPEDFIPPVKSKLKQLEDLNYLKSYIWFDPEAEKEPEKKRQYDELKQKLKNLNHVEAISSGLEELKEVVFVVRSGKEEAQKENDAALVPVLYLIVSDGFPKGLKDEVLQILLKKGIQLLEAGEEQVQEKRLKHYQNLQDAGYCLLCYDGSNPEWLFANINEVRKSAGFNPGKTRRAETGIISLTGDFPAEVNENSGSCSLISALSPSLEGDLSAFIYGK